MFFVVQAIQCTSLYFMVLFGYKVIKLHAVQVGRLLQRCKDDDVHVGSCTNLRLQ